jgi:hypothetical protein
MLKMLQTPRITRHPRKRGACNKLHGTRTLLQRRTQEQHACPPPAPCKDPTAARMSTSCTAQGACGSGHVPSCTVQGPCSSAQASRQLRSARTLQQHACPLAAQHKEPAAAGMSPAASCKDPAAARRPLGSCAAHGPCSSTHVH